MSLRMLIVGPPSAGKGTLAEAVVKHYGVVHLSTGDLLRHEIKVGSPLGLEVKSSLAHGRLVSDNIIVELVLKHLKEREDIKLRGVLLDGFPRTKKQADMLVEAGFRIDVMVVLDVEKSVLKARCLGRRVDPVTGFSYHIQFNPPPADIASRCITRPDDTENRLERRIGIYEAEKAALLEVFKDVALVLDGNRNMNHVFAEFNNSLSERLQQKERIQASEALRSRASAKSKL